jgi:hypothetical protein
MSIDSKEIESLSIKHKVNKNERIVNGYNPYGNTLGTDLIIKYCNYIKIITIKKDFINES